MPEESHVRVLTTPCETEGLAAGEVRTHDREGQRRFAILPTDARDDREL
jgi:hypothetical protein